MAILNGSLSRILLLPLVAPVLAACATGSGRPGSMRPPSDSPAIIALPQSNSPGGLDQIRNAVAPSVFVYGGPHPHTRPAKCKKCVVTTEIYSIGNTTDITPINGPGNFGPDKRRIIGRVFNKDTGDTEDEYSLKPNSEYLIWVAPAPLNNAGTSRTIWGLLELPPGHTGPIEPITIGYVELCEHTDLPPLPKPWTSDTDFKDCTRAARAHPTAQLQGGLIRAASFASLGASSLMETAGDLWFDCGGYCCTGTGVAPPL